MKKNCFVITLLIILSIAEMHSAINNYWTDIYNIEWKTPSNKTQGPMYSMPFGGGDIGCNVWVEDGDILLYAQKSGSFSEIGECLKLGRFRLRLSPNPFLNTSYFSQKLTLKNGTVSIVSIGNNDDTKFKVDLKLWIDIFTSTIHLDILSEKDINYTVRYEGWRYEDKVLPHDDSNQFTKSAFSSGGGLSNCKREIVKLKDNISFSNGGILFYHRNPENTVCQEEALKALSLLNEKDKIYDCLKNRTMGGLLLAENSINAGTGYDKYRNTNYIWYALKSKKSDKNHHIIIANYTSQDKNINNWVNKVNSIATKAIKSTTDKNNSEKWWRDFWDKSRIVAKQTINDEKKDTTFTMIRNYQLGRFLFACNYYGEYPTKFNGGNFTVDPYNTQWDPDWRPWNGFYHTSQNQRLIYWTMLKSGDEDEMMPQFNLFNNAKAGGEARVKKFFGHEGLAYDENLGSSGLPMAGTYDYGDRANKKEENQPFPNSKIGNSKTEFEAGITMCSSTKYHFLAQVEHSYMMLEYHRFTGKSIDKYIPFIKSALIFFDQHYRARQKALTGKELDENGKLVFDPSMACEKYGIVKNPTDLISGLQACLEGLIKLDSKLITDKDRVYYKDYLTHLPNLPFIREYNGHKMIAAHENCERKTSATEVPQLYPLFPFNRYSLANKQEMELFKNTWKYDPCIMHDRTTGWQQLNIFTARMGLTDEAFSINREKLGCSPKKMRFPALLGPAYDGVPDMNWLGAGMIGIQEMLLQTIGNEIRILPAWPDNVDIEFKLHAPYNTTVEVSYKNGKIEKLNVAPKSRLKDVICDKNISLKNN